MSTIWFFMYTYKLIPPVAKLRYIVIYLLWFWQSMHILVKEGNKYAMNIDVLVDTRDHIMHGERKNTTHSEYHI